MAETTITMSAKELSRYEIIKRLIHKDINGTEAARQLFLSVRQVKRLRAKVKKLGANGLQHGNKGKKGNKTMNQEKIISIKSLVARFYSDFGPTLAAEKLFLNYKIKINKETLRQLMIAWGFWKPKPRKQNQEYRSWRPRKEYFGEMQQFDGSYHAWFENRAPRSCLLAAIDDATGKITKAELTSDEGVSPVFIFWRSYVSKQGKPASIYLDRHSTYHQNQKSVLNDPEHITQFERAMKNLGIKVIHAYSPQAKGRIERLFGTLQDRLVKELRLQNISTLEKANCFLAEEFLPEFNQRFAVLPEKRGNLHKELIREEKNNLDRIFSIQDIRTVNNDFTIRYENQWLQLDKAQSTLVCRKDRVLIEKRLNNEIRISLRTKRLNFQALPERPKKIETIKVIALTKAAPSWKPPIDHPWRHSSINHINQKLKVATTNSPN